MAYFPARKGVARSRSAGELGAVGEKGTAMVEFVLCMGLIIIPLFFGVIVIGLSLVLANQVTEVCRDVGHMFAYQVDFSQVTSQQLVTNELAQGLGMTTTGGNGVIYLSKLTYVDGSACSAAGYQPDSGHCPNINQIVVIKRLVIGNTAVQASAYAPSITPSIITSTGSIGSSDYLVDTSVRAESFSSLIPLTAGQYAYVSEMFVNPPTGALWSLFGTHIVAARSVF